MPQVLSPRGLSDQRIVELSKKQRHFTISQRHFDIVDLVQINYHGRHMVL